MHEENLSKIFILDSLYKSSSKCFLFRDALTIKVCVCSAKRVTQLPSGFNFFVLVRQLPIPLHTNICRERLATPVLACQGIVGWRVLCWWVKPYLNKETDAWWCGTQRLRSFLPGYTVQLMVYTLTAHLYGNDIGIMCVGTSPLILGCLFILFFL